MFTFIALALKYREHVLIKYERRKQTSKGKLNKMKNNNVGGEGREDVEKLENL